jgi:purine-binding chemotaxis protein CheW
MSDAMSSISERAGELRREFDRAFAEPIRLETAVQEDLLGIRVGEQPYAMRLSEIAGLHAGKKITRVPGGNAALCGIAGFRGALLPVYDLHVLLGHSGAQAPRWLVVASTAPVALAFDGFAGQLRVTRDAIVPQSARPGMPGYAREVVRTQNFIGPILHLPSLLEAIKALRTQAAPTEE